MVTWNGHIPSVFDHVDPQRKAVIGTRVPSRDEVLFDKKTADQ